jgi:hypothetical protein
MFDNFVTQKMKRLALMRGENAEKRAVLHVYESKQELAEDLIRIEIEKRGLLVDAGDIAADAARMLAKAGLL